MALTRTGSSLRSRRIISRIFQNFHDESDQVILTFDRLRYRPTLEWIAFADQPAKLCLSTPWSALAMSSCQRTFSIR